MCMSGVKLLGKQTCLPGRVPLVLAAGSITYQTKSGSLETQMLPSHAALKVWQHCLQCTALPATQNACVQAATSPTVVCFSARVQCQAFYAVVALS